METAPSSCTLIRFGVLFLMLLGAPSALLSAPRGHNDSPPGMVWIPDGEFGMGSKELTATACPILEGMQLVPDAQPVHPVKLTGFWMDTTEVTNAQFREFVEATGYVTVAERRPAAEELPSVPEERLVAGSAVYTPAEEHTVISDSYQWWRFVPGANWRHPEGPESDLSGRKDHPVVHIAYQDAKTYCEWKKKRLPTEAEFEFAARGGLSGKTYPWGDEFRPDGKFMANTFQGRFPVKDSGEDGFVGTAPVRSFPPNGFGLYDVAGNVWEWCSDWYRPDYYATVAKSKVIKDPQGPDSSLDPQEPGIEKRVHRGGSYLCTDQYCSRYKVGTRGKGEPNSSTNHLGLRCVKGAR